MQRKDLLIIRKILNNTNDNISKSIINLLKVKLIIDKKDDIEKINKLIEILSNSENIIKEYKNKINMETCKIKIETIEDLLLLDII